MKIFGFLFVAGCVVLAQSPPPPPAPVAAPAPSYQRAGQLPARIMDFKAEPASLQPGQPVMLSWATENPTTASIDPDPGRVPPRGTRQLTPARTTTYTLTVHGPNNQVLTKALTVNVAGTTPAHEVTPVDLAKKPVPKMADGKPDLTGVYDFSFGGGRGGRGPAPEGPVLKPGAEKFKVVRGPTDSGQYSDCMPLAGPQAFAVPYQFQLVQSAHNVAILHGYPGTFRVIPTAPGLQHPEDPDPTWMGDSIGHWEGDTLVVDTVGFNDKTEINGFKHTEALHLVERFRRAQFNALQYDVTLEDPNVFVKPWTLTRTFSLRPELDKVDEFVCEHVPDYSGLFEKKGDPK